MQSDSMTTIPELLNSVRCCQPNMKFMVSHDESFMTMKEVYDECIQVSLSILKLGVEHVTIFAENSPKHVISILGSVIGGSIPSLLYHGSTHSGCEYVIKHTKSRVVFVDTLERLKIILKVRHRLDAIVLFDETNERLPINVFTWKDFITFGSNCKYLSPRPKCDDCCMIIYTSGTTGNPKGVMLSHDNLTFSANAHIKNNPVLVSEPMRFVSHLPLCHIGALMNDVIVPLTCIARYGQEASVYFIDSPSINIHHLRRIRPTMIFCVPRLWQRIANEGNVDLGLDQMKLALTGGAHTDIELIKYFRSIGVNLLGAYGMSELMGVQTVSRPDFFIDGYSGVPVDGTEVRVDDDTGELCFRGRQVTIGYYGQSEKCVDENGWFHTGDIGEIHETGHIRVIGRIDDLIVTSTGNKIVPDPIESHLQRECQDINRVILVGDNQKFVTALIEPTTGGDVSRILETVEAYNNNQCKSKSETIRRVTLVKITEEEVTPSNKIKRRKILKKYEDEIKAMYFDVKTSGI